MTTPQDTKTSGFVSSSEQALLSRPEYAPPQFSKAAKQDLSFSSDSLNQLKENLTKPYKPDLPKLADLGTHTDNRYIQRF